MKLQKQSKLVLLLIILMLSFGFNYQSLAGNYSDIQTKTTQSATVRRKAIYPSNYEVSSEEFQKNAKKNTFGDAIKKMVRALLLVIALFGALIAYLVKNKEKFKKINILNKPTQASKPQPKLQAQQAQTPPQEIDPYEAKIRTLAFKFFKLNK